MRVLNCLFLSILCFGLINCSKDNDENNNVLANTTWSGQVGFGQIPNDPPEPFSLSLIGQDSASLELKDGPRSGKYTFDSRTSTLELDFKIYNQKISAKLAGDSLSGFNNGAGMTLQFKNAKQFKGIPGTVTGSKWNGTVLINFVSDTKLAFGQGQNPPQYSYTIKGNVLRFKPPNTNSFAVFSGTWLYGCHWLDGGNNVSLWVANKAQ